MDFNDKPEEATFRQEVRAWLDKNAERRSSERFPVAPDESDESESLRRAKEWQAKKADAGWVGLHWPKEYGGRGLAPIYTVIYQMEEANYIVPRGFFEIGLGMAAPVLMAFATEEQRQRYVPKMTRGEEIWCQLFSEPVAGSDLAGLRTSVRQHGDEWVVNGQKVWTSGAYYSDYAILVARHDPHVAKHKGLTYFFIDMRSPGVEVRRIKSIPGRSHFCEVFFTDVRVPDSQRLGEVGEGWGVAVTTLMHERLAVGQVGGAGFDEIFALAQDIPMNGGTAVDDSAVRDRLADWYVQTQGLKYSRYRTLTALSRGEMPGPEASIVKVVSASQVQQIASFAMELLDMGGVLDAREQTVANALFQQSYLSSPGSRIAGGTDEILRNIIAERVLGLPPDIRVDKGVPFNEVPGGMS